MDEETPEPPPPGASTIPPTKLPKPADLVSGRDVFQRVVWSAQVDGRTRDGGRDPQGAFNAMLFVIFAVPTLLFAMFFGEHYMRIPYYFVIVWVHEAGHGFWCLLFGRGVVCSLMGFGSEMLFVLVPALICLRERRTYYAACVFLMCVGMSLQHNGLYMQSSLDPQGTSFAGALTGHYNDMGTEPRRLEMHDWSNIFRSLGIVKYSFEIGYAAEAVGRGLSISFLLSALIGLLPLLGGSMPKRFFTLSSPGGLVALLYFIAIGGGLIESLVCLALAAPLFHALSHKAGIRI